MGAASFYVPFKKVKEWAWESYWIMQGVAAWLVAPLLFAWFTVPDNALFEVLAEAPDKPKWLAIMFGALWGVGGLTFGLSIRYLGVALGQSLALGLTAAFGTLVPPIVNPDESLSWILILGVSICVAGIAIIGYAGSLKNKSMTDEQRRASVAEFALKKGVLIAILARVMSGGQTHRSAYSFLWNQSSLFEKSFSRFHFMGRICHQCRLLFLSEY